MGALSIIPTLAVGAACILAFYIVLSALWRIMRAFEMVALALKDIADNSKTKS